jgi:ketopantoate reductase
MKMLIVGAGGIGTVYGAHVAAAGSKVSVLGHGPRTSEVAVAGLSAREVLGGRRVGRSSTSYDTPTVAGCLRRGSTEMKKARSCARQ